MHESIIQIRQAIDRKDLKKAKALCKKFLQIYDSDEPFFQMKIKALLGWALMLTNEPRRIEEARKLISPIREYEITTKALWGQINSEEINDPSKNRRCWVNESLSFWRAVLEAYPENEVAKEAIKHLKAENATLVAELHAKSLRASFEAGEEIAS